MKLVKKDAQVARNLELVIFSHSKNVSATNKNGIVIAVNTMTKKIVHGIKQVNLKQTCFKLKIVDSTEMAALFI